MLRAVREIASSGHNSPVLEWIAELGGPVQPNEQESGAGIIHMSRFYRLREGRELPLLTMDGAGGDLGYLAFAGFYGDDRTFSITFGVPTGDRDLMALRDEDAWEAVIRTLTPLGPWTQPDLAAPDALLTDPVVLQAAAEAHATKDHRPPAPTLGPPREELLAVMATATREQGVSRSARSPAPATHQRPVA